MKRIEVWKDIPKYENVYQISNLGRIRSLDRKIWNKGNNSYCNKKGIILKTTTDKGGYEYTSLYKKEIGRKTFKIHRLVAFAFCNNYKENLEVNHIDGIRSNNNDINLEWCTRSENIRDTYKRGRLTHGEKNNASKLFDRDIGVIASLYDLGVSQKNIAKSFGVSQGTISNIIRNKHYKNGLISKNLAIEKK